MNIIEAVRLVGQWPRFLLGVVFLLVTSIGFSEQKEETRVSADQIEAQTDKTYFQGNVRTAGGRFTLIADELIAYHEDNDYDNVSSWLATNEQGLVKLVNVSLTLRARTLQYQDSDKSYIATGDISVQVINFEKQYTVYLDSGDNGSYFTQNEEFRLISENDVVNLLRVEPEHEIRAKSNKLIYLRDMGEIDLLGNAWLQRDGQQIVNQNIFVQINDRQTVINTIDKSANGQTDEVRTERATVIINI